MKTNITLQEAIEGIKGLFNVKSYEAHGDGESFMTPKQNGEATFFFDKRQYWRGEVIERLTKYFEDKNITDGLCRIDAITLLWTTVHLEKLPEYKEPEVPFVERWEKYRDLEVVKEGGKLEKLRDMADDELKSVVRKKMPIGSPRKNVSVGTIVSLIRGEIMYRIDKEIYKPSF